MRNLACLAVTATFFAAGCGSPQPVLPDGGATGDAGDPVDAGADAGTADAGAADAGTDAGLPPCATVVTPPDYCQSLPRLSREPIIDGLPECGIQLHNLNPQGWTPNTQPIPNTHTARYAAAWHPNGLYVFMRIVDIDRNPAPAHHELWCGDGVEIYVDDDGSFASPPGYDLPGTRQFVIAAPFNGTTAVNRGSLYANQGFISNWTSDRFRATPTADGYDVEAFIRAQDLGVGAWSLAENLSVGLTLGVTLGKPASDTNDCNDHILGQYYLTINETGCAYPSCDVGAFCTPTLTNP